MTTRGFSRAATAVAAAGALGAPAAAQAVEAHYLADLTGSQKYSGYERYVRPQGSTCTITDTHQVKFNATFKTPQPIHLVVSSKQGGTFSPAPKVTVRQTGFSQTHYDHEGDASCGEDADSSPSRCAKKSRTKVSLLDDLRVINRANQSDTLRSSPDHLTLRALPNQSCFNNLPFAEGFVYRYFLPATTGKQKLAKLLSPNTERITLTGSRKLLEGGVTRVNEGDWQVGWSSFWKLKLVRIDP